MKTARDTHRAGQSYAIVANGFGDGPAETLREHLVRRGRRVVAVSHPLTPEQGTRHVVATYAEGEPTSTRTYRLPLRPPASFAADPFIPLRLPRVDAWFGFNPLACARGLVQRRLGRADKVVLWSVDFVPDRFGRGTLLTRLYDRLDRLCCITADARIELSAAARNARNRSHGLVDHRSTHIVPMGAWLDRLPVTPPNGDESRRIVYLGHLVPRQGVDTLLEALALLKRREGFVADVIGSGPEELRLRDLAHSLGLQGVVRFHGFLPDHREVERLLAQASLAVAPYRPDHATFTRYADPGKLKAYLAAGLPIVLTDVPPNAGELANSAGAEIVAYEAEAIADALSRGLASPERWLERRNAALTYARQFDWPVLLDDLLAKLGLEP
jgi:glycosyltransferase involved in cell wall biosynthesis